MIALYLLASASRGSPQPRESRPLVSGLAWPSRRRVRAAAEGQLRAVRRRRLASACARAGSTPGTLGQRARSAPRFGARRDGRRRGASGSRWRLKAMRRGGDSRVSGATATVGAPPGGDAFGLGPRLERGRSDRAARRLIVERRAGLARGAMAFAEIEGSEDLARRAVRKAATRADFEATIDAVRAMHDRGGPHPISISATCCCGARARSPESSHRLRSRDVRPRAAPFRRAQRRCAGSSDRAPSSPGPGPFGPAPRSLVQRLRGDDADLARRWPVAVALGTTGRSRRTVSDGGENRHEQTDRASEAQGDGRALPGRRAGALLSSPTSCSAPRTGRERPSSTTPTGGWRPGTKAPR
jgi:hypothetical protein